MLNENIIKPEANGKYVVKTPSFTSFYLPSLQEVSALLGLPDSLRKMIPLMESHAGIKLNVGKSSRAKMHTEGFAKPTFKKFMHWLNQLPIPFTKLFSSSLFRKSIKAALVKSNSGAWYSVLRGMNASNYDHELIELVNFIEKRSDADYLMLSSYKVQVKKGTLDEKSLVDGFTHQLPTWTQSGLIPGELFLDCNEILQLNLSAPIEAEKQEHKCLPAVIAMRFDFYLAAIANYEIGLTLYAQRNGAESVSGGFMWPVIKAVAVSDKPCYCFTAMIEEFKKMLSENRPELGWRELASYIEINESGTEGGKLKHKQYNQLNDWRNNQNLPSDKKFRSFVEAAVKPLGHYDIEHILIYARIARGLDTLVQQTYAQFKCEHTLPVIVDTLARYPEYLDYYKKQAMQKQKVAA